MTDKEREFLKEVDMLENPDDADMDLLVELTRILNHLKQNMKKIRILEMKYGNFTMKLEEGFFF